MDSVNIVEDNVRDNFGHVDMDFIANTTHVTYPQYLELMTYLHDESQDTQLKVS